jgi:predicted CXXCH cytochrome family protein
MATGRFVHAPVAAGDCVVCHDPHHSPHRGHLKKNVAALCRQCHEEKFAVAFTHGQSRGGDCLACHDPHQSSRRHLLKKDPVALCRSCHGESGFKGDSVHQPVEAGDCIACHDPHGSAYRKNLKKNFSADFYPPYKSDNYELCFSCHDREIISDGLTETLTNFRNGRRNLHAVHVNRPVKGRNCKTCHDPHASGQALLIRRRIPGFGTWSIPIGFTRTANGGTCLVGCHKPRSYSRVNEVEFH